MYFAWAQGELGSSRACPTTQQEPLQSGRSLGPLTQNSGRLRSLGRPRGFSLSHFSLILANINGYLLDKAQYTLGTAREDTSPELSFL